MIPSKAHGVVVTSMDAFEKKDEIGDVERQSAIIAALSIAVGFLIEFIF